MITISLDPQTALQQQIEYYKRRLTLEEIVRLLDAVGRAHMEPFAFPVFRAWVADLRDYMPADWNPPAIFRENP